MTIKEVSEKYNISADTIRYYERIGLIPPVPRKPNGIRDFDQESCNWIEFVRCLRDAGVQIEALIDYVHLFYQEGSQISLNPPFTCSLNKANLIVLKFLFILSVIIRALVFENSSHK